MSGSLQADELGHVFEVLTENEALAFCNYRYVAHPELEEPLTTAGVIQDINGLEVYAFTRKKLFRPKTTASARLGKKYEFFSDGIHQRNPI